MAKTREISARARRCWQRLTEWYGVRLIESYGSAMPPDWCEVVDRSDNATVTRGLIVIRSKYVTHPPTLPQFEQALAPIKRVSGSQTLSIAERLCKYAMEQYGRRMTAKQLRGPWTYLGKRFAAADVTGKTIESHGVDITGVVIDPDGEAPGYRIMAEDIDGLQLQRREFLSEAS